MWPVIGLLLSSLHSMTSWSEQECLLSKKLLPLCLIFSAFCSWFTVVKCPELVSCLSVSNTFLLAVTRRKEPGRGNPFPLQLNLRLGSFSSLFLLFQRLLFQVQGLCCEVLESAVVPGLGPWNPCNSSCRVTWLGISQSMWHWVGVTSGSVERQFLSKHLSCDKTNSVICSYFCFLMFCNGSIFVGICFSIWCVLSWWCQV